MLCRFFFVNFHSINKLSYPHCQDGQDSTWYLSAIAKVYSESANTTD